MSCTSVKARSRVDPRWESGNSAQRKQLIVGVAMDLLARCGSSDVTMRRIAKCVGVGTMTLYSYVNGQEQIRAAMIERGFEMLREYCESASELKQGRDEVDWDTAWRGGAVAYVRFALQHPNLYKLMFSTPIDAIQEPTQEIGSAFQTLVDLVRHRLVTCGVSSPNLELAARRAAVSHWIMLHGIASLALSGRLTIIEGHWETIVDDMLARNSPDTYSSVC